MQPFRGAEVALGPHDRIIYAQPTPTGDLVLKCFDGIEVQDVTLLDDRSLQIHGQPTLLREPLIYNFHWTQYRHQFLEQQAI